MSNEIKTVKNPFGEEKARGDITTSAEAQIQKSVAEVQAALIIAQRFPRNQKQAMDRILTACQRKNVAEYGIYSYPKGGVEIEGASIRLAEVMMQNWGNASFGTYEISRSNNESEMLSFAWDFETNLRVERKFFVKHTRDTKRGSYDLTDEREIYEKTANYGSRRTRACILALIPKDVIEAAMLQCDETMKAEIKDLPAAIKLMLEKFNSIGISKEMIEKRIQRKTDSITAAQILQFRKIFNSIKDGLSKIEDWFDISLKPKEANTQIFDGEFEEVDETKPEPHAEAPAKKEPKKAMKKEAETPAKKAGELFNEQKPSFAD